MEPKQRKRDAVGNLRELAQELGVTAGPSASDWKKEDFLIVHRSVEASAKGTPEHRQKATDALALYFGTVPSLPVPPFPLLPPIAGAAPAASPAPEGFRLRSTSCLLTWNALVFASMVTEDLWTAFLAWLGGLTFIFRWTATTVKWNLSRLPIGILWKVLSSSDHCQIALQHGRAERTYKLLRIRAIFMHLRRR